MKTHVFKKELQEYVPTQCDDRHRIETIIYVELSIVKQDDDSLAKMYDYVCFSKEMLSSLPDKVMPADVVASKRILNVDVNLKSPSNDWRIEKEACARCVRRMSAKLEQDEIRVSSSLHWIVALAIGTVPAYTKHAMLFVSRLCTFFQSCIAPRTGML